MLLQVHRASGRLRPMVVTIAGRNSSGSKEVYTTGLASPTLHSVINSNGHGPPERLIPASPAPLAEHGNCCMSPSHYGNAGFLEQVCSDHAACTSRPASSLHPETDGPPWRVSPHPNNRHNRHNQHNRHNRHNRHPRLPSYCCACLAPCCMCSVRVACNLHHFTSSDTSLQRTLAHQAMQLPHARRHPPPHQYEAVPWRTRQPSSSTWCCRLRGRTRPYFSSTSAAAAARMAGSARTSVVRGAVARMACHPPTLQ
jgi:hypothetical protein